MTPCSWCKSTTESKIMQGLLRRPTIIRCVFVRESCIAAEESGHNGCNFTEAMSEIFFPIPNR